MPRDMAYLLDIPDAANRVKGYMAGVNRAAFEDDEMRQLAVIKLIEIIGEAARRVSKEFQDLHPEIPWARRIGMRHVLIHNYDQIVLQEGWDAATLSVPRLIAQLEPLVPPEDE